MNLKDMYKAWVSTSKDKKYTADLFNVKLKSGEEVLCRDYSDIPAEDIVLVTKYAGCYLTNKGGKQDE